MRCWGRGWGLRGEEASGRQVRGTVGVGAWGACSGS